MSVTREHRTKIVATLGPSSSTEAQIEELFMNGVDVFRLNFSHGEYEEHQARYDAIRAVENKTARPIAIMMDLQGPKLRVGTFADDSIQLEMGDAFRLDLDKTPGDQKRVCLPHPEIFAALKPDTDLLLDDGRVRLRVQECGEDYAETIVAVGGPLSNRKGVNVPGVILPLSPLTEKDRKDLEFGLEMGVDWVALSFVQRPEDIIEAKKLIQDRATVVAKLEKPSAIDYLEEIVEATDGVMVARGDLGVEMPPEDVPILQTRIVKSCRKAGKPVIVATQMLDSMVERPVPTRAEATDVANAVKEGADAVMLSAETAAGAYPVEAVKMMNRIILRCQQEDSYWRSLSEDQPELESTTPDAISAAVYQVAGTIDAKAIATYTNSGSTTLRVSRQRPKAPIICLTPRDDTARRMALVWGVHSTRAPDARSMEDMIETAVHQARIDGFVETNDRIVITAGLPFGTPGKTNILRIARIQPKNQLHETSL
ncbi:pyruvate kinase [Curvivirga sp.]|uniref:pyruvate kinase n=1 Tax=Curvivirga sp. TaxID=2856848 RepID=UPI003B58D8FA